MPDGPDQNEELKRKTELISPYPSFISGETGHLLFFLHSDNASCSERGEKFRRKEKEGQAAQEGFSVGGGGRGT